ncbi:MAG: polyribonucleotide nucleotidyltransferase [Patescibacteria group bacterium]|nr:polyribonucleotide nucleotidyltransferase [Patescibacteria group bacterium]
MHTREFSTQIGGKELVAQFSDLAEQASGSCLLRYGNTAVLATAVMSEKTRDDIDYFPLTVDYEERFYAAGAILGSRYVRREGRPSEDAILSGRIVDRTIRPLFPQFIRNEVQVIITVLALDEEDLAVVAVNAASLALATSNIPWAGPVSAVRIGKSDNNNHFIINPTYKERENLQLDLLACGRGQTINMVEVAARQVGEDEVQKGFELAVAEHTLLQEFQENVVKEIGKEKRAVKAPEIPAALNDIFAGEFASRVKGTVFCGTPGKDAIHALMDEWMVKVKEHGDETLEGPAMRFIEDKIDQEIHRGAVEDGKRADNRAMDEVRPLFAQAGGVSPVLHGSGIFYRGGTHVFTALTLGGPGDSQVIDSIAAHDTQRRFMHHYNFPPFSSGETGRVGGTNRRMIGHGKLAEKALEAVLPAHADFPYTIRLVSECFASNGSTSMGSVCAGTLALMDGGVPIVAPVAGIAMGVMSHAGAHKVLTDIQGPEDEFGGMDFKVAGTRKGITAIQLDIKLDGIALPVLAEALAGAKAAREHILDTIEEALPGPRESLSPRAPQIISIRVRPDQIGLVIGGGGKTINGIKEMAGVEDITIEDDGSIFITGRGGTAQKAREMIEAVVKEYKPGEVYEGEVVRMMDFGAFVKFGPTKDAEGLVHVSEVAPFRINKISDALKLGEKVRVMIKEIDEKGRLNLSIKAVDPDFASRKGLTPAQHAPFRQERPDRP